MSETRASSTELFLKKVGDIEGEFIVPGYQRGYRWGDVEVRALLDDLWDNRERPYSLQPVVVKHLGGSRWELIDGQQRLTTLYLLLYFMHQQKLKNVEPPYSLVYQTRKRSAEYLRELDHARRDDSNIDFFHINDAYARIRKWFDTMGPTPGRRQSVADELYVALFKHVSVIWYQAAPAIDSTTLFTRLNVGRIPLTNAELVKALLLSRSQADPLTDDRSVEIANQWDTVERDLRAPDLWAFVSNAEANEYPTRIELLLDLLAGGPRGRTRPSYHTFDGLRERVKRTSRMAVWNEVLDLHALFRGWYEDRDLYHKVGFLIAEDEPLESLVAEARANTRRAFHAKLDDRIRKHLNLRSSALDELSYESASDKRRISRLLLLMNVETTRQLKGLAERFSFRAHKARAWSLEHIHAQHAEDLQRAEQWETWLRDHRRALAELPVSDASPRDKLVARIDRALVPGPKGSSLNQKEFAELARDITLLLTPPDDERQSALESSHSLANLALLSGGDNASLSNSTFDVKRRRVLRLDREGAYIPICTRRIFLKYYTDTGDQQLHFWSSRDREAYLSAMIEAVEPYLTKEAQQ